MKNLMKVKRMRARRSCPKMKPLAKDQEDWPWAAANESVWVHETVLDDIDIDTPAASPWTSPCPVRCMSWAPTTNICFD